MDELGVPTYDELVFVARREDLDEDGASRVRRFLQATARGHRTLRARPGDGRRRAAGGPNGLDRGLQEAVVRGHAAGVLPRRTTSARSAGRTRPSGTPTGAGCTRTGCSSGRRTRARALTNEFLPGEGLDPGASGLE